MKRIVCGRDWVLDGVQVVVPFFDETSRVRSADDIDCCT